MGDDESDISENPVDRILEESGLTVSVVQDWLAPMKLSLPEAPPSRRMKGKLEFEEKQFELRQRIEELRKQPFQPEWQETKDRSLSMATMLMTQGKLGEAKELLDSLAQRVLTSPPSVDPPVLPEDEQDAPLPPRMKAKVEFEEKQFALRQRIEGLRKQAFLPEWDEMKEKSLSDAALLVASGKFDEATKFIDELTLKVAPSAPLVDIPILPKDDPIGEEKDAKPLPSDPLDAINKVLTTARAAQETIRLGTMKLLVIQGEYLDAQRKRAEKTNPSEEFNSLTEEMSRALEEFKLVNVRCGSALAELKRQEQLRDMIAVDQPNTSSAAVKLHGAAKIELAKRVQKAEEACAMGADTELKLAKAFREGGQFTAREGVKLYEPENFELPSVLRDLMAKIKLTTGHYRGAKRPLTSALLQLNEWLALAGKGRPLPETAAGQITVFESEAGNASKDFGKWNAAINNPWKSARNQAKPLKKEDHLETLEVFWRAEKLYDEFSSAFGEADEEAKSVMFTVGLLKAASAPPTASPSEANDELTRRLEEVNKRREIVNDPIGRLITAKDKLAEKKKVLAKIDASQVSVLESALTDLNQVIEKAQANLLALQRAMQEVNMVGGLIKTRYSVKGIDKKKVERLKKATTHLGSAISPALKEGEKTVGALIALRDEIMRKSAALGKAASVEDTVRLQGVLKDLPPLPGKDALFPAKGVSKWKAETAKGGDQKSTKLFADVTKAWELAEKTTDSKSLDALDRAAAIFLQEFESSKTDVVEVNEKRAEKCREAQRLVRKMRLTLERDSLPEPPWTEAHATTAKKIEAGTLLENGTPAKAPSAKGESDSFFINNSDGKPAFIFKPKQGENVKTDLGGREGEGVVREVLTSKFNDQMKEMIGVDFGVSPTGVARLESDSFANGEKSSEKSRVGALQQAIPNEGSLLDKLAEDPGFAKSIKTEDVQKVALMDFLTLQGDRNAGNLLVQDVGGEKRLVPIDGGFAFPSTELFGVASAGMCGGRMDVDAPAPTSEEEREKAKGGLEGKNALMLLPQSEEKFSEEMLKSIAALDPGALARGLKKSSGEISDTAPEVGGLVTDENIENVRRSAVFIKKAAPLFTVAELAEIYATDFKRILAAPVKQLDKEITAVIALGRKRADFNKSVNVDEEEYKKLGGDGEIVKLGWEPKLDRMLRLNLKRKIGILKKGEKAPPPKDEEAKQKPPADEKALEREYKTLGGDKELLKVIKRPDGNSSPKLNVESKLIAKLGRLRNWKKFGDYGGDSAYRKLIALYRANQYTPFDQLPKNLQAAVATFAASTWDPDTFILASKVEAFIDFNKFKK